MTKLIENLCRASLQVEGVLIFGKIVRVVPWEFLHVGAGCWSKDEEGLQGWK